MGFVEEVEHIGERLKGHTRNILELAQRVEKVEQGIIHNAKEITTIYNTLIELRQELDTLKEKKGQ